MNAIIKSDHSGKIQGILAMAATAFLWSTAGLFIKLIDWNPVAIAGTRSLIASLVMLAFLGRPRLTLSFPQVMAGTANAATMLLFVVANKTTTAANAIILQYVSPLFTAVLGMLILKERVRAEQWAAFPLVALGMAVMFMDRIGGGTSLGNGIALLSGLTFSLYFIYMRRQKDGSPIESILLSHWITAGTCLIISFFLPVPAFTARSFLAILALGIFQIGITAILFSIAIKRVSAVSSSLIAVIEPVFNPLWVFIALGETPSAATLIGGGIIIAAITAVSIITARR